MFAPGLSSDGFPSSSKGVQESRKDDVRKASMHRSDPSNPMAPATGGLARKSRDRSPRQSGDKHMRQIRGELKNENKNCPRSVPEIQHVWCFMDSISSQKLSRRSSFSSGSVGEQNLKDSCQSRFSFLQPGLDVVDRMATVLNVFDWFPAILARASFVAAQTLRESRGCRQTALTCSKLKLRRMRCLRSVRFE